MVRPINIEYYTEIPRHIIESLWEQEVNMDDWDYMLFIEGQYDLPDDSTDLNILLQGCCENVWYKVKNFIGRSGILGVAYHS